MSDPFVAEIRIVGFNYAPTGWAHCNGQLVAISQNSALFSLLGTFFGGDGQSTFALPNLQGTAPMHPGQGPGLSPHSLGESSGAESVTLLTSEMPAHTHTLGVSDQGNATTPAGHTLGLVPSKTVLGVTKPQPPSLATSPADASLVALHAASVAQAGGSQPHNNMQPYLVMNFCIALQGIYPSRG